MDEELYDLEFIVVTHSHQHPTPRSQVPPHNSYRMENLTAEEVHNIKSLATASWSNIEMDVRGRAHQRRVGQ